MHFAERFLDQRINELNRWVLNLFFEIVVPKRVVSARLRLGEVILDFLAVKFHLQVEDLEEGDKDLGKGRRSRAEKW